MSDDYDEYRRHAQEAQAFADRAISDTDRAAWLKVVQGWLGMLPHTPETSQQKFETAVDALGTGQLENDSSN